MYVPKGWWYEFSGWYSDLTWNIKIEDGSTLPQGTTTLYAKWICPIGQAEDNGTCVSWYTVSFYDEGDIPGVDSPLEQVTVLSWDAAVYPSVNPTKEGYTFVGWVDENGDPVDLISVTEDMDVFASYDIAWDSYTVHLSWDSGIQRLEIDGQEIAEAVRECGSEVPVNAVPKLWYHFVRWDKEERFE